MKLKFAAQLNGLEAVRGKFAESCTKAEHIVAVQALKDTAPFVPMLTGSLNTRARSE